jgi:hypothetical protein
MLDWAILMAAGVLAPLGWPVGKALSKTVVQLIPGDLRSYPVAAFMWSAVVVGLPMPLLYEPGDSLVSAAAIPWLLAQIPAALLTAGIYGILEGWLVVNGSRDWWPMRPPDEVDDVDFGFDVDDLTGPGVFPTRREEPPGDPSPIRGP